VRGRHKPVTKAKVEEGHTIMRAIRNRISREEGVAAVEFALILPVLALLLFGILEFGRVWSQYQLYQGAAREGARCAAVAVDSECDIEDSIEQAAQPFDVTNPIDVSIVGGGGSADGCTPDTVGQDVQVSWEQELQVTIPFWNDATFTPTVKAVFRCEG
jgi:Flp pilus assembly protein TadG